MPNCYSILTMDECGPVFSCLIPYLPRECQQAGVGIIPNCEVPKGEVSLRLPYPSYRGEWVRCLGHLITLIFTTSKSGLSTSLSLTYLSYDVNGWERVYSQTARIDYLPAMVNR